MSLYRVIGASALASLVSGAWGSNNGTSTTPAPGKLEKPTGLISIPLKRANSLAGGSTSIQRRFFQSNVLGVYGAAYLAEISIGTSAEPQKVEVLLDTGSFELWVNPDCQKSYEPRICGVFGQYDPTKSSTSKNLQQPYQIQYGSGSTSGTYYMDDIFFSGAKITAQQFGVANMSDAVWFGIMGLARGRGNGFINYNTIVDSIAAQGYANSRLFSMDLGPQGQPAGFTNGQIVFGGVDTSKFDGTLIQMLTDPNEPHYTVYLNNLDIRVPTATEKVPVVIFPRPGRFSLIVDSGTTLSLLPKYIVDALAAQFPGAVSDGHGGYTVPCAYQQQNGTVAFSLSATSAGGRSVPASPIITVNVPYSEFIWNAGGDFCYLGAWADDSIGVYILGDTFLRGAYVVFDQDTGALYMGDRARCSGPGAAGTNLVAVPAGRDQVLNITGTCALAPGVILPGGSTVPPDPAPSSTSSTSISVTLPGGTLPSTSLGGSAGPTINPVGPVSVSISTSAVDPGASTTSTVSGTTTPAASSPPVAAPTSTPSSGTGLDPNAVPAGGSGSGGTGTGSGNNGGNNGGNIGSAAASAGPSITGGSGSGSGSSPVGGGNDPNVRPNLAPGAGSAGATGTMSGTITSTITNLIVYTVTACPANAGAACVTGQLATRTNVYVTTICPTPTPAPAIGGAVAAAPAQDQGGVVVTVKEQCRTSTYAVTSCPPGAVGCTVGAMTTQTYTEYRTFTTTTATARQTTVQTVNSPAVGGGNNGYSSPGALPPAVQVAGGSAGDGSSSSSSSSSSQNGAGSSSSTSQSGGGSSSSSSSSNGNNGSNGSPGSNGSNGSPGSNGSNGGNGINGSNAAATCAGTNCTVVAQGSVPMKPVYAGADGRMGTLQGWWAAVGIGALALVLGGS
ncbi:hypothetical protein PG999_010609 [Apiospora kogelbergensis]|uniref:Peptidase A1 domain-containing protein n=1 Tax=Apiospora kogelbergensis TaxID=1337665 RepID=A0AAW0QC81_9PEZI